MLKDLLSHIKLGSRYFRGIVKYKVLGDLDYFYLPLPKSVASVLIFKDTPLSVMAFEAPAFTFISQTTRNRGLSCPQISHTIFAYTSLALSEFHGQAWLQVKLEKVVFWLRILATFPYILFF